MVKERARYMLWKKTNPSPIMTIKKIPIKKTELRLF
jgi:hypothetical protein